MEILIVTPEIAPYSGHSELGALAAALPKGLRGLEHHVVVLSPLYDCVDPSAHSLARRLSTLEVTLHGETQSCTLYDGRTTGGVDLLFIGHPGFGAQAEDLDHANARRVALILGQAAAALVPQLDPRPEVVHALSFQAALCLPLLNRVLGEQVPATVLTPHAVTEQGQFDTPELVELRPGAEVLAALDGAPQANLLAAGLRSADRIVTHSQTATGVLLNSELTAPMRPMLSGRKERITQVPPGLDSAYWNPLTDSHLTARYDAAETGGKVQCRSALQYEVGFPARHDVPLFAVVGQQVDEQETEAISRFLHNDVQLILSLTNGTPDALRRLVEDHTDKLSLLEQGDPGAQHRLLSGADFLWLPLSTTRGSLWHLRGLRYGTLPIVHGATPAAEAVVDCDLQLLTGTGFVYSTNTDLLSALQRAAQAYTLSEELERLRRRAMRVDVSWERSARRFEHLYRQEISRNH